MPTDITGDLQQALAGYARAGVPLYYEVDPPMPGRQERGIAFVYGGGGNDSITDTANGLGSFHVGNLVTVAGSTSNDGTYEV